MKGAFVMWRATCAATDYVLLHRCDCFEMSFFFYAFCLFKFYCCQGRKTLQQQSHLTKTLNGKSFVKIILQKLLTMYTHECDESSCLATVKP